MCRYINSIVALVTISLILFNAANAQQTTCVNAQSMSNVNFAQLEGTWYEVARNPGITNMSCIEWDLGLKTDKKNLDINVTYVDPQEKLWKNSTMTSSIGLDAINTNGFQITFSKGGKSQPVITLKLLNTDYTNYAFVCGYYNTADAATGFSAVLTRLRNLTEANLLMYEQLAAKTYTNFNQMTNITQSEKCYKSGASAPLPIIATIFGVFYALLKYIY